MYTRSYNHKQHSKLKHPDKNEWSKWPKVGVLLHKSNNSRANVSSQNKFRVVQTVQC